MATAADSVATDHFQKSKSQDGGLPELLLAYSFVSNHSFAEDTYVAGDHQ